MLTRADQDVYHRGEPLTWEEALSVLDDEQLAAIGRRDRDIASVVPALHEPRKLMLVEPRPTVRRARRNAQRVVRESDTLGAFLTDCRRSLGWSQSNLALRAGTKQCIVSILERTSKGSPELIAAVAQALDCEIPLHFTIGITAKAG